MLIRKFKEEKDSENFDLAKKRYQRRAPKDETQAVTRVDRLYREAESRAKKREDLEARVEEEFKTVTEGTKVYRETN